MNTEYVANMSQAEHDELCCSYSALMLHDEKLEITAEKIQRLITCSGNTVDAHWPRLFAKALEGANIDNMLTNMAPAAAAPAAAAVVVDEPVQAPDAKPEKVEIEEACLMDLFGDDYGEE